jgi:hypothetical protein
MKQRTRSTREINAIVCRSALRRAMKLLHRAAGDLEAAASVRRSLRREPEWRMIQSSLSVAVTAFIVMAKRYGVRPPR